MKEFKGTPGPWSGKDVGICRQDEARLQLGFIMTSDEKRRDECAANAHLIAAAPELLEALQNLMANYDDFRQRTDRVNEPENQMMIDARAAIAKALGETK